MSTILVTGGAGFIGSHLVRALLAAGHRIKVLDSLSPQIHGAVPHGLDWLDEVDFVRGSVTSEKDVRSALETAEMIVHLAAETGTGQSMYEIASYCDVNVQGTAVLLHVLANGGGKAIDRIVLASSRSVYGEGAYVCGSCDPAMRVYPAARSPAQLAASDWDHRCPACSAALTPVPTREDDRKTPASIYASTKLAQEDLVRVACQSLGIGYAILRLQNVYGEGQSLKNPYTGILSIFSTRIRRGLPLPIFEDGLETRDFVHVEDVVHAVAAALHAETPPNRPINVGAGVKTTVADVAAELSRAFGAAPDLVVTGQYRVGDIRHNRADIAALRDILGYQPRIGLAEGLRRFAAWVQTQALPEDLLDKANSELKRRRLMN